MTKNKDQMRAEFEARQFRDISTDAEQRERNGHGYRYMGVDNNWDTWQAAWQAARASANGQIDEMAELIDELRLDRDILKNRASAQQGVPEGWQLVPRRPTQSMCDAAKFYVDGRLSVFKWADGYYAMLAAAPQPVAQKGQA